MAYSIGKLRQLSDFKISMALPLQVKSAISPFFKGVKVIGPTGVAVLLSVGAHAALLAAGPRTDFSFEALSRAAQAADAEETIVPLVQLTPAEQSRLPNFAQPRLQPPGSADFGSLSLPSGLPFVPNTSIPKGRTIPADPFPSATLPRTTVQSRTAFPRQALSFPLSTPPAGSSIQRNTSPLSILPDPPTADLPDLPAGEENSPDPSQNSGSTQSGGAADLLPQVEPSISIAEAIARAEGNRSAQVPDIGDRLPSSQQGEGTPEATQIPVDAPTGVAVAPAQGNASRLLESFRYDDTDTSTAAAEANAAEWLAATADGKRDIVTDSVELTIDSEFKTCLKENPPDDGLIGVVVNPDGTQEDLTVLKSTGYDVLNRQAIDAVERNDFGTPAVPTQYQVQIAVTYNPSGCVESLPDEPAE